MSLDLNYYFARLPCISYTNLVAAILFKFNLKYYYLVKQIVIKTIIMYHVALV